MQIYTFLKYPVASSVQNVLVFGPFHAVKLLNDTIRQEVRICQMNLMRLR